MPWLDDGDPSGLGPSRWRDQQHTKIHRFTTVKVGPSVIAKQILFADSAPGVAGMIDWRSGSQKPESTATQKRLQALKTDPFGLQGFCVTYSMDKRKRWTIVKRLRDIGSLQDDSVGCRVSALEQDFPVEENGGWFRDDLLMNDDWRGLDHRRVHSYHTVTVDGKEIHRTGKQSLAKNLAKPPNKPRTRSGKKRKEELRLPAESVERPFGVASKDKVDHWKRPVHILYRVTELKLSKRKINSRQGTRSRLSSHHWRSYGYDHERRIDRWRDFERDMREDERGSDEVDEPEFVSDFEELEVETEIGPVGSLADYILPDAFVRVRKPKRTMAVSTGIRDEAFEQWLEVAGNDNDLPVDDVEITGNDDDDASSSTTIVEIHPLPFVDLDFGSEQLTSAFLESRCSDGGHDCGIWPPTYCVHSDVLEPFSNRTTAIRMKADGTYRLYFNDRDDENSRDSSKPIPKFMAPVISSGFYAGYQLPATCMTMTMGIEKAADELLVSETNGNSVYPLTSPDMVCSICFTEDEDGFALAECGHFACLECWLAMVAHSLSQSRVPIKCMCYNCDVVLKPESCHAFLPWRIRRRYEKALALKRWMRNDWCECSKCNRWMHFDNRQKKDLTNPTVIVCDCGTAFCLGCRLPAHLPLSCEWNKKYEKMLADNHVDSTAQDIVIHTVNVKRCPACDNLMERSAGCNHMTCSCGMDFCYVCMEPWTTGTHYNCNASMDAHVTVMLEDVPRGIGYNLNKVTFQRCMQHRNARNEHKMRTVKQALCGKNEIDVEIISTLETYKTAQKLLEYTLVRIAYEWANRRNRRINRLRSMYRRCGFLVERFEQAVDMRQLDLLKLMEGKLLNMLREMMEVAIFWV